MGSASKAQVSSILYLNPSQFSRSPLPCAVLLVSGHCSSLITCIWILNLACIVFSIILTLVSSVNLYLILDPQITKLKRLNAENFAVLLLAILLGVINLELLVHAADPTSHINQTCTWSEVGFPEQLGLQSCYVSYSAVFQKYSLWIMHDFSNEIIHIKVL